MFHSYWLVNLSTDWNVETLAEACGITVGYLSGETSKKLLDLSICSLSYNNHVAVLEKHLKYLDDLICDLRKLDSIPPDVMGM